MVKVVNKTECDIICIPREEYERLRAGVVVKPKKAQTKHKTTTTKKNEAPLALPTPKTTKTKTVKAKASTTKKKAAKPKKPTTVEYRIIKDDPRVSEPPKLLEKRTRTPIAILPPREKKEKASVPKNNDPPLALPASRTIKPPREEKIERRHIIPSPKKTRVLENLKRVDREPTVSDTSRPPSASIALLPASTALSSTTIDDDRTITLPPSDVKVIDLEDCSQGNFFQRQACKRRNRKKVRE